MTRFLDVNDIQTLLRQTGVAPFIRTLADYVQDDYLRWHDFDKSARVANHSDNGVIELMPVSDARFYGFKYVNGHPVNTRHNLLTVMAFSALAEVSTGYPLLLCEFTLMTALRTAATSALAARCQARPDSRVMALIGNGAQSEFQALAFHAMLGIDEIRLYDVDQAATAKLMRNLAGVPGLKLLPVASVRDAVRGADIVTTVTADKTYATILTADMIEPGMHLNAVGGDCPGKTELDRDILQTARVMVEFEAQTRLEGEIQQMPADSPVVHFWQVLSGQRAGRESREQVTVFDSVGFALEDFSTLRYLRDLSQTAGVGKTIDLIPEPDDCKDLYSLVAPVMPVKAVKTVGAAPVYAV
ncbi:ornithine cyclodeaminase [Pandoraea iniqua]|uniref:Ornithine cyclodeaminase n=1 Tax=Pandoraea iniqua TaxID=2508288 RepID=A0A5E4UCE5_9BURK|nr:ornithine cyclodeaminase [Pandoraea iniqua]VVD97726.1 ornithine cyclodeaminase [Pandoraea iniqua]